jgi:hypothetical protein
MKRVVISQPMFFPWVGLFEQVRLADVYVHYDDVQFSKGHFVNRVQVKTAQGSRWLTVPLKHLHLGQRIDEVRPDDAQPWRQRHLALLAQAYRDATFLPAMLDLVRRVYEQPVRTLADLTIASMEAVCRFLDLAAQTEVLRSSALGVSGTSTRRVLDIVRHVGGDVYITGHGAKNYLDHELFEADGIRVEYIDYQRRPYPQLHGEFTPSVSILDLIANMGTDGRGVLVSPTVYWRDFLASPS